MKVFGYQLPGMSSLILWGLLWEIVGRLGVTFFIPPLSEVFQTLFSIIGTPAFMKAISETAYAFVAGVSMSKPGASFRKTCSLLFRTKARRSYS